MALLALVDSFGPLALTKVHSERTACHSRCASRARGDPAKAICASRDVQVLYALGSSSCFCGDHGGFMPSLLMVVKCRSSFCNLLSAFGPFRSCGFLWPPWPLWIPLAPLALMYSFGHFGPYGFRWPLWPLWIPLAHLALMDYVFAGQVEVEK